jgi:hypothetical protein
MSCRAAKMILTSAASLQAQRGVASSDKGKLHRAAQELPAQARTSAYSAIGPYHAFSVRCRAVKMVMTSAASLRAIRASSVELPGSFQLKRPHRRIRPWGRIKRSRYAAAPSGWFHWRGISSCDNGEILRTPRLSRFRPLRRGVGVWDICVVGGDAPRLTSRPERASDMHPQAPNTKTFLPACLLSTACEYY